MGDSMGGVLWGPLRVLRDHRRECRIGRLLQQCHNIILYNILNHNISHYSILKHSIIYYNLSYTIRYYNIRSSLVGEAAITSPLWKHLACARASSEH